MSNDKLQTACAWSLSNRAITTRDRHFGLLSAGQPSQAAGQDAHGRLEHYILNCAEYLAFLLPEYVS